MASFFFFFFFFFFFITAILLLPCITISVTAAKHKQTYIVHMKHNAKPSAFSTHHDWYASSLQSLSSSSSSPEDSLLYTYDTAYDGFAASLEPHQAEALRQSDAVLGVYEDTLYTLHTTRSPQFLGIINNDFSSSSYYYADYNNNNLLDIDKASSPSYDIVIGVLDTGVWPESKSFDDLGMPDVPSKWRGQCETGPDFSSNLCNKKLVGARFFSKGSRMEPKEPQSPRDYNGHGTHAASIAAGSTVANASLFGYASGVARGMAMHARVAAYKVCWKTGCFGSDILAGIDRAIQDGVDVLSMSLGGASIPYYRDTTAIGAFAAMEKGIVVSCSAGNRGPAKASLGNVAPWIMTVGAGTIDRGFPADVFLGNKNKVTGVSIYSGEGMGNKPVGLVYNVGSNSSSNLCLPGSIQPELVAGKVVVCDRGTNSRVEKGVVVSDAGGIGMIMANTATSGGEGLVADSYLLPAVAVGAKMGDVIREYAKSDPNPMARLAFGGTVVNVRPSPVVAAFSSRGPNKETPQILKPDLIGPGVNILAAWTEARGPSGLEKDTRREPFNIQSGTSMACPHISGLAGLLKAAHPEWSPSAIKSALMTTAYVVDNTKSLLQDAADGGLSTPFAHGSGYVDPVKAMSPGLVYDATADDYISFVCSLGYTIQQVQSIVKRTNITCSTKFHDPGELNYPSFSVLFGGENKTRVVRYTRELTNVGLPISLYTVTVNGPSSVGISVTPKLLLFRSVGEKKRYTVTFVAKEGFEKMGGVEFGSIVWGNSQHRVTSPVAFSWTQLTLGHVKHFPNPR